MVFANNFAGIQLLLWNDYDNTIDGCHFANNSFGVQMHPFRDANAYVRNCRFERSSVADLQFAFHSSSVRRSVSVGSAAFVLSAGSTALGSYVVQDCRVDKWTSPKGAIQISHRGPLTAFDNRFTRGPSGRLRSALRRGHHRIGLSTVQQSGGRYSHERQRRALAARSVKYRSA